MTTGERILDSSTAAKQRQRDFVHLEARKSDVSEGRTAAVCTRRAVARLCPLFVRV